MRGIFLVCVALHSATQSTPQIGRSVMDGFLFSGALYYAVSYLADVLTIIALWTLPSRALQDGLMTEALAGIRAVLADAPATPTADRVMSLGLQHVPRLQEIDLEAFARDGVPPVAWIREHLIAERDVTLVAGRPGEGKSTFAYALGVSVAAGAPFLNSPATDAQPVLIFDGEAGEVEAARLAVRLGAPIPGLHLYSGRFSVTDAAICEQIERTLAEHVPALVIFDSLTSTLGIHDENDAGAVTRAFESLFEWRDRFGTSFLIVCHLNKPTESRRVELDRLRGSSALSACASNVLYCEAAAGALDVVCIKARGRAKGYRVRAELVVCGERWALGATHAPRQSTQAQLASAIIDSMPDGVEVQRRDIIAAVAMIERDGRVVSKALTALATQGIVEPVPGRRGAWRLLPTPPVGL